MQLSQKEVVGVLHDLNDGDGCLELLDGEFEVGHGGEFGGLVEVDIGQEVEPLVGVGLVGLLVFAHLFQLVENRNPVRLLQVPGRRYDAENRQRIVVVEVRPER